MIMNPANDDVVETFADLWRVSAEMHTENMFLTFVDVTSGALNSWSYGEFDERVQDVVSWLRSNGVDRGSVVHVCLANCPAFIAIWLAVAQIGATLVPADPVASVRDLSRHFQRLAPAIGVCAASRGSVYSEAARTIGLRTLSLEESAADLGTEGPFHRAASVKGATASRPERGDRLAVMFTSGTTSEPKGVELTQANYRHVAMSMAEVTHLNPSSRWYVSLPLFHANAQFYCFASAIAVGASVGLASGFTASRWLDIGRQLEVTRASLFAAPIRMILAKTAADAQPLALEYTIFAQSLAHGHYQEITRLLGCAPRQIYGMTETLVVVTCDDDPEPDPTTIGRVIAGRPGKLVDAITRETVKAGTPGMIAVAGTRGRDLFAGYLADPATTEKSFYRDEGRDWFATGDLARECGDGRWEFVGRLDDVIKVAGENVSLTEVEAAIAEAPGVLEAAVVAVPDEIRDVVPVAYVVARNPDEPPSAESLEAWALQNLTPTSRPRSWNLTDALPRTSVGKIRRFAVGR